MGEGGEGGEFPPKKAQSDSADLPAKKLARQLDFTGSLGGVSGSVALPEHPQSKVTAVAAAAANTATTTTQQAAVLSQPKPKPQMVVMPAAPSMQGSHASVRAVKPESPKSRTRPTVEVKDGTPKKQKQCNCKHSRCLKFVAQVSVSICLAVFVVWEAGEILMLGKHNKGCHCKKSGCFKKYCECFQANILCSENCKCLDCKNFEGSEERQALFHGDHANNMAYIQQAANAAITGAIGSSGYASPPVSKRRKGQELLFGPAAKDPSISRIGHFQQANNIRAAAPSSSLSSVSVARAGGNAASGSSKFTYRSLLADIIQPQDLKELCSVLVVVAGEAAKSLADQRNAAKKRAEDQTEVTLASAIHDQLQSHKDSDAEKTVAGDCSSANQVDKVGIDDSSSDGVDALKGRPMSPGTLALMCDEQDTMFMAASSPNGSIGHGCSISSQLPHGQGMTEIYAEQERIVLTKFRDCLNRLITFGEIKETKCSSLARTEIGNQRDPLSNGTANDRTESGNQPGPICNGVVRTTGPPTIKTSQMVTTVVPTSNNDLPKFPAFPENGDSKPKIEKHM
ncbi:protein tesmin/TSO1-like CXC 5 [Carica papaya]|uniref:protein tesmin/TSO1-like CXC 5 n=1 Tax=Carica papaya TaxID=3649 RepID=UPI000B8C94C2|nr:protein tesmin/TSO1-like CXC 5 [Carica papaya]